MHFCTVCKKGFQWPADLKRHQTAKHRTDQTVKEVVHIPSKTIMSYTPAPKQVYAYSSDGSSDEDEIQTGSGINNNFKRAVNIMLKLSRINAFDELGQICGEDGSYIPHTSVESLISCTQRRSPIIYGEQAFLKLLHKAKVELDDIVNELSAVN
jgi:hypothetical protein